MSGPAEIRWCGVSSPPLGFLNATVMVPDSPSYPKVTQHPQMLGDPGSQHGRRLGVLTQRTGVMPTARPHLRGPRVHTSGGPAVRHRSVSITVPSMLTCEQPPVLAAINADPGVGA
jgi:hypothetical protein